MKIFKDNKEKIKILYIINDLLPGGAQRVVYDLASFLDKDLYEIEIIYLRPIEDMASLFIKSGIKIHCLNVLGSFRWGDFLALRDMIKSCAPDIVHMHLPLSVIVGTFATKLAGLSSFGMKNSVKRFAPRIIAHEHNTYELGPKKIFFLRKLAGFFIDLSICYSPEVELSIFQKITLVDAVAKAREVSFGMGQSITILNSINTSEVEKKAGFFVADRVRLGIELGIPSIDENTFIVLSVGRLLSWRGHQFLIQAMAKVKEFVRKNKENMNMKVTKIVCLIAGYGPMEDSLKSYIAKLGLEDTVFMLGKRNDAYELMLSADIFSLALSYDDKTVVREALGVASLEAMACGLPCIISDYPSARMQFSNNSVDIKSRVTEQVFDPYMPAVLVPPKDPDALANAIADLIEDPGKRKTIGLAGKDYVYKNRDIKKVGEIYDVLYR